MLHAFGWAALAVLGSYLVLFFWGGLLAAQAAGRPIWLFGQARGRLAFAAVGFRLAFTIALMGPLLWLAVPVLHKLDPLWTEGQLLYLGVIGVILAALGAMLAFAAQMSMGVSWRVGVKSGDTGALVQGGLFRISRNPTFLGQLILLAGVALAIPSVSTVVAVMAFLVSANVQIRAEEAVLAQESGADYATYLAQVPRWIGWLGRSSK